MLICCLYTIFEEMSFAHFLTGLWLYSWGLRVLDISPLSACCQVTSLVSDSVRPHGRQPTRLPRPWDSPGKNTGVGCHFLLQCMKVESESEVTQSFLTLSDPMTAAYQAPPSMGNSGQQYWSGVPLPSPKSFVSYVFFKYFSPIFSLSFHIVAGCFVE